MTQCDLRKIGPVLPVSEGRPEGGRAMVVPAYLLIGIGAVLMIGGGIGILIAAFNESVIWGLGCLVVPIVSLIFVITHWAEAKNPFAYNLLGLAMVFVGGMLLPKSA